MPISLPSDIQFQATEKLNELFKLAISSPLIKRKWKKLVPPALLFNQRGKIAGSARLRDNVIKLNAALYLYNQTYFLNQVIAHELAHILVYQLYGTRVKPHGIEWQQIMISVFNLHADVTHQLDTSVLGYKTYPYSCNCQIVELSQTRHNKVQRHTQQYKCRKCGVMLKLV